MIGGRVLAAAKSGGQRAVQDEEGGARGGHVRGCDVHHVQGVAEGSDDERNGGYRQRVAERPQQGFQGVCVPCVQGGKLVY